MKSKLFCAKLQVRRSPIGGYGVFALQDFAPGEKIEECRTLIITKGEFNNYVFSTPTKNIGALPLGYGALYNHADVNNADYKLCANTEIMTYTAIRPIKCGEEICISYGKKWFLYRELKIYNPIRYRLKKLIPQTFIRFMLISSFIFCLIALAHK